MIDKELCRKIMEIITLYRLKDKWYDEKCELNDEGFRHLYFLLKEYTGDVVDDTLQQFSDMVERLSEDTNDKS